MFQELFSSSYFSLFVIIALGYMLGSIKIKGLSLDVSAVIFIALLFGHLGISIDKSLGNLGLVIFIYTIGIQAGPGFFDSFKTKGKTLIILAAIIILTAGLTAFVCKLIWDIETPELVGLIAGSLTSTPGLAVAIDATHSPIASIAYGIAYPFGVIGVILFVKLLPKIIRKNPQTIADSLEQDNKDKHPDLETKNYIITNPSIFNKTIQELRIREMTGAVISRIAQKEKLLLPKANTVLREGDRVKAVGDQSSLQRLEILLGETSKEDLSLSQEQDMQAFLISNKEISGKTLNSLNLQSVYNSTVTRVRRSGIDIAPTPALKLKFGDKLTIVGNKNRMRDIATLLGNNKKKLSDTDFFPIALGIVLGILFGKLNISFSEAFSFSPGLTGGILIIALILSAIGKTGPILWSMSGPATHLLRQLGLLLFLAEVGTSAGANLVSTFQESGWLLFGVGFAITLVPMIIATIIGMTVLKINLLDMVGTLTGGMTSTPGLAAADSLCDSSAPSIAYATVYPIAMVLLIILIQFFALVI